MDTIADKILSLIMAGKSLYDIPERELTDSLVLYLSDLRGNILRWYPFYSGASVLVFDNQYGAIAEAVSKLDVRLDVITLTTDMQKCIASRCEGNPRVFVSSSWKELEKNKYDYIYLPWSEYFRFQEESIQERLDILSNSLKRNGHILFVFSNTLGISGITGVFLDQEYNSEKVYSISEVEQTVKQIGLTVSKKYYPYPNAEFTTEIFTDKTINSSMYGKEFLNYQTASVELCDKKRLLKSLKQEGISAEFADTIMLDITNAGKESLKNENISYVKLSMDRKPEFQIYTMISENSGNNYVYKVAGSSKAIPHINKTAQVKIENENCSIISANLLTDRIRYPYLEMQSLEEIFSASISDSDWEKCEDILDLVWTKILGTSNESNNFYTTEFQKVFGRKKLDNVMHTKSGQDIDLILDNIFIDGDKFVLIDPEWTFDFDIPIEYVMWRIINECYTNHPVLSSKLDRYNILNKYGIGEESEQVFREWEMHFTTQFIGAGRNRRFAKPYVKASKEELLNKYFDNICLEATLWIDGKAITKQISKNDQEFVCKYEIPNDFSGDVLRWDPCEYSCVVKSIYAISDNGEELEMTPLNGHMINSKGILFNTDDPAFGIALDDKNIGSITIFVEVIPLNRKRLSELYDDQLDDQLDLINELHNEKERLENSNMQLERQIEAIKNGKLWKIHMMKEKMTNIYPWMKKKYRGLKRRLKAVYVKYKTEPEVFLKDQLLNNFVENVDYISSEEVIDVIVPIYNGYDYLTQLFPTLLRTKLNSRIFLVDDKSPDPRVHEIEEAFAAEHENVFIINNEENYGFVKSVNNALQRAENHIALVNTDTVLPDLWLERLMAPILLDDKVASTTPYTNSATIFSFPNFCYNNPIYRGMTVDQIDEVFAHVKPRNIVAPTGVGFCMGMNKHVIDEIGTLDYETFSKGFGEENDWCQRAVKAGYKNVQVENLFVYHKHGGSFQSEEKTELLKHNVAIVNKRYPNYERDVNHFIVKDLNKDIRELCQMILDMKDESCESILAFDHCLGGGATAYLDGKEREHVERGDAVTIVRNDLQNNCFWLCFHSKYLEKKYRVEKFDDLITISKYLHFDTIYINELVTYPVLRNILPSIIMLKKQQEAKLVMLFHDYFAVCPSINLMTPEHEYCGLPAGEICKKCYESNPYSQIYGISDVSEWQKMWKEFLNHCDEIRTFSEDTEQRVRDVFGSSEKITLVPHQVESFFPINKNYKTTDTINIGLLGTMAIHKGALKVQELLEAIQESGRQDIRVILIGQVGEDAKNLLSNPFFRQTGEYSVDNLVKLVYENDIDLFFISSVWPETFSYTTEEIMQMNMPIASFDIGAPAYRIKRYERGIVISEFSGKCAFDEIVNYIEKNRLPKQKVLDGKKIVYLLEYKSFSSRYRLEHLQEELLQQGIEGEVWEVTKIPKRIDWNSIGAIVIYRCRNIGPLKEFITEAKNHNIRMMYDIDDMIFDYSLISNLSFLEDDEYKDFDRYAADIHDCMSRMDMIITSTDTLQKVIQRHFPAKKVIVNRNRASAQMQILSNLARKQKGVHDYITLGYFSGSGTHNDDFRLISDVLFELLRENKNLRLKIVGVLELDQKFDQVQEQIEKVGFVDWKKLPELIASVDINLMPLEDTLFHRSKSENKWMEAALVGVPTVASYNSEIANHTLNHEDIILCKNDIEWREALNQLISDHELYSAISQTALKNVMKEKTTLRNNEILVKQMFEEMIG